MFQPWGSGMKRTFESPSRAACRNILSYGAGIVNVFLRENQETQGKTGRGGRAAENPSAPGAAASGKSRILVPERLPPEGKRL